MMRSIQLGVILTLMVSPLAAQNRPPPQQGPGSELRQRVMQRFVQNFVQQARLTEDQQEQFGEVLQQHFRRRSEIDMQRRQLVQALDEQLSPGVAADADSVASLLGTLVTLDAERGELSGTEQEALSAFMTPVQRGLFVLHFTRFQRQIDEVGRQRMQRRQGQRPSPRAGGGSL